MKTITRLLIRCAVIVFVLVALAVVTLHILLLPEKVRDLVTSQLTKHLHREVRLKNASFGLWSGVDLEGLSISERPTFQEGTFLRCQRAQIKLAWLPLLRHEVQVRELRLAKPEITVIRS